MKHCKINIRHNFYSGKTDFTLEDLYEVYIEHSPRMRRMYTDDTLPDELKQKLGLLLGSKQFSVDGIGHATVVDNVYTIHITDELYAQMIGEINDEHTRSQSKGEGQESTGRV